MKIFSRLTIGKRQKFIIVVLLLTGLLFFSENLRVSRSAILIAFSLSMLTNVLWLWANFKDIKDNFSLHLFILPFSYSLAFGLFYFLLPDRLLMRVAMSIAYAVGLYSMLLSQNIFTVASMRTIALLTSARTVSLLITIITYFFLANTIFSLHFRIYITTPLIFVLSFFLIMHSLWTHTLEKELTKNILWITMLSVCMVEAVLILWFWPAKPTVLALFLAGLFYTIVGLSHVWFDRRLFRGILWEYVWVAVIVTCILLFSTYVTGP